MSVTRRGFLGTVLALGAAPAIVRASSLMPLWVPKRAVPVSVSTYAGGITWIDTVYPTTEEWQEIGRVWTFTRNGIEVDLDPYVSCGRLNLPGEGATYVMQRNFTP